MPDYESVIRAELEEQGVPYELVEPGAFLVRLAGEHKQATMAWLVVGDHSLRVEAFFMRRPEENLEGTYRFLLERNARSYGVHFSVDRLGDVFLTGHVPLAAVSPAEIDRLLGCVLSYADDNFDQAVLLGFGDSIRAEAAWRRERGEDMTNLRPYLEPLGLATDDSAG